jgi:hypothetical protein
METTTHRDYRRAVARVSISQSPQPPVAPLTYVPAMTVALAAPLGGFAAYEFKLPLASARFDICESTGVAAPRTVKLRRRRSYNRSNRPHCP